MGNIHRILWMTSILILSAVLQLYAADLQPGLQGVVLDGITGEPIPGATIILTELERGTAADSEGRFSFEGISPGTLTIEVRSVGFTSVTRTIEHPADGFITIKLQPSVLRADDVIVTGSPLGRNIRYQPAQAMNAENLQRKAAPSLGEILDGNPGVATRSFGSAPARPVIRGMDGDRVLVMQNGERMGDLSATAVDHAVALDPLSMERVEVIRGPASLMYGSGAIGGVVNMFSHDMPREWDAGTRATIASHVSTVNSMGAGLISARHGNDRFAATGRMIYRNGGDLQTPEGRLPDTAIDNLTFGAGVGYRSGRLETGLSMTGMNYTYGLPEAIDDVDESIEIRMNRFNIQSISTVQLGGFFDHAEVRLHYTDYNHDEIEIEKLETDLLQEEVEISFSQQTVSSSLVLRHRPVGAMEGAIGLSFNRSQLEVGGADALTPNASGYFLAGYLYEEISLSRPLTLKTGLRLEWKETFVKPNELFPDEDEFEDRSDLVFSGALGLNYSPNENWTAGVQVARAYRTPTIEELYSFAPHSAAGSFDVGDPTLGNEFSIGSDLFVEHRNNRFRAQLSLFANRIDNFVDFTPTGTVHEPSGLPVFEYRSKDAILFGFEFDSEFALSDKVSAGLGFDYVRGRERDGDRNNLTFIPPFRTHLQVMYDNGTWWVGPRARFVNRQEKTAPNEEATDGYLLAGADAGYRLGHGFTFTLRLDNLLNERYRDHLSRVENRNAPMPGRNLNAMLRWEF
jgi:iron complex outermembrane recepter protein